jgi:hypothetical protein
LPPIEFPLHCVVEGGKEVVWDKLDQLPSTSASVGVPSLFEQAMLTTRMNGLPYGRYESRLGVNIDKLDQLNVYYYPSSNPQLTGLRGKRALRSEKQKVYLSRTTLVVVPDNLMDQWVLELYKVWLIATMVGWTLKL